MNSKKYFLYKGLLKRLGLKGSTRSLTKYLNQFNSKKALGKIIRTKIIPHWQKGIYQKMYYNYVKNSKIEEYTRLEKKFAKAELWSKKASWNKIVQGFAEDKIRNASVAELKEYIKEFARKKKDKWLSFFSHRVNRTKNDSPNKNRKQKLIESGFRKVGTTKSKAGVKLDVYQRLEDDKEVVVPPSEEYMENIDLLIDYLNTQFSK